MDHPEERINPERMETMNVQFDYAPGDRVQLFDPKIARRGAEAATVIETYPALDGKPPVVAVCYDDGGRDAFYEDDLCLAYE